MEAMKHILAIRLTFIHNKANTIIRRALHVIFCFGGIAQEFRCFTTVKSIYQVHALLKLTESDKPSFAGHGFLGEVVKVTKGQEG